MALMLWAIDVPRELLQSDAKSALGNVFILLLFAAGERSKINLRNICPHFAYIYFFILRKIHFI